jgi:hypothetical protein
MTQGAAFFGRHPPHFSTGVSRFFHTTVEIALNGAGNALPGAYLNELSILLNS